MSDFDVFLFWNVKNIKVDINGNIKRKICTEKFINTSLKVLSIALIVACNMKHRN